MSKSKFDKEALLKEASEATNKAKRGEGRLKARTRDMEKEIEIEPIDSTVNRVSLDYLVDAPDDINPYSPIKGKKYYEMMFSIIINGLIHPIVVWRRPKESPTDKEYYMILSGHNRKRIFMEIYSTFAAMSDDERIDYLITLRDKAGLDDEWVRKFDYKSFKAIPAIIKDIGELDDEKAQEMAIDANYQQRGNDPKGKNKAIMIKLKNGAKRYEAKEDLIKKIAGDLKTSKSTIYNEKTLAEKIHPKMKELYFEGELKTNEVLKFRNMTFDMQEYIYDNYKDQLKKEYILKITTRKKYSKSEIDEIFTGKMQKKVTVSFKVQEDLKEELKKHVDQWIRHQRMQK